MKSIISFLIPAGFIFFANACRKNNNDKPDTPQLAISNISVLDSLNKQVENIDVSYNEGKINEVRISSGGIVFIQSNGFEFDDEGRIAAYRENHPDAPEESVDFKLAYNENGLATIQQFEVATGALKNAINITHDGNIVTTRKEENGDVLIRVAAYDDRGNVEQLALLSEQSDTLATINSFNYDDHPNTLDAFFFQLGNEEFLLPSKNNPGFSVVKEDGETRNNQFSYEYNGDGLPVKKVFSGISQQFLFGYTEIF